MPQTIKVSSTVGFYPGDQAWIGTVLYDILATDPEAGTLTVEERGRVKVSGGAVVDITLMSAPPSWQGRITVPIAPWRQDQRCPSGWHVVAHQTCACEPPAGEESGRKDRPLNHPG